MRKGMIMKRDGFLCDRCGTELDRYGERYILRIERVPAVRETTNAAYDLCPNCARRMKKSMEARPWLMWKTEDE